MHGCAHAQGGAHAHVPPLPSLAGKQAPVPVGCWVRPLLRVPRLGCPLPELPSLPLTVRGAPTSEAAPHTPPNHPNPASSWLVCGVSRIAYMYGAAWRTCRLSENASRNERQVKQLGGTEQKKRGRGGGGRRGGTSDCGRKGRDQTMYVCRKEGGKRNRGGVVIKRCQGIVQVKCQGGARCPAGSMSRGPLQCCTSVLGNCFEHLHHTKLGGRVRVISQGKGPLHHQ